MLIFFSGYSSVDPPQMDFPRPTGVDTCCYIKVQVTSYVKKLKDFFSAPRFPCWMKSETWKPTGTATR